jgi:cell division transport system permease protein
MKFRTIRYYLAEAFRNLIRNRLMSVASVLTVASCIFIVSVFYCLAANVDYFLSQLEDSMHITVFLLDELSPDEVLFLSDKILAIPHVTSARYSSSQDALDEARGIFEGEGLEGLLDGLDRDNPLRRSFDIEIESLRNHEDVIHALEELAVFGVDNIRTDRNVVETVQAVSNVVRVVCLVLILILGVISIVIITNTIRITVNARKAEINIMKYVGATDWFIRWPFAIEGILIGLLGGILPSLLCWLGYDRVVETIKSGLPVIAFIEFRPGYDIFSYLFPFAITLGMMIGVAGSFLSIRKHLKV